MLSRRELTALRAKLPKDGYQRIAARTSISSSMVGKVLREPKHFNERVIEVAIEVIKEYKDSIEDLKTKVKDVIS